MNLNNKSTFIWVREICWIIKMKNKIIIEVDNSLIFLVYWANNNNHKNKLKAKIHQIFQNIKEAIHFQKYNHNKPI